MIKKITDFNWGIKKTWLKFRDWIYYNINYKENLRNEQLADEQIVELNKTIEELNDKILKLEIYNEVKSNLLDQKDQKIIELRLDIAKINKKINDKVSL